MINNKTVLKVSDNSGAKTAICIKILGGFKKKHSKIGNIIVVSVKELRKKSKKSSKVKRKEIYKALIIKTRVHTANKSSFKTCFFKNTAVLLNKQGNPIATRILEPLPKSIKCKKLQKIMSISRGVM